MVKGRSPAGRKPALYARFSSDIQNPSSVEDQLARLRGPCRRRPSTVLVFSDAGVSGSVWKNRPGIQKLLAAVKRKEVSCIHAEAIDRISRAPGDLAEFRKQLQFYGVGFVTASEGIQLDGSAGSSLTFMVKGFVAEHSVQQTADKSQRGLRANALARKTTGGRTYGYARTKIGETKKGTAIRRNDIDPEQGPVVRLIFQRYAQGLGYASIAAELNAKGVPAPQGKRNAGGGWVGSCIREMLRNPRYIGDWAHGRREWSRHPDTERRVVRRVRDANNPADAERLVEAKFAELAIIDRELWDNVQAKLSTHADRYARREVSDRKSSYLLTGLLRCGRCGGLMQIAGGTHARYRCAANSKRGTCDNSLSIREATIRGALVRAMSEGLAKPENLARLRQRIEKVMREAAEQKDENAQRRQATRDAVAVAMSTAEARLKKLYLRWADSPDDTLDQLMSELRAEIAAGKGKLAQLDAEEAELGAEPPTAETIESAARFVASLGFLNDLDAEPFPDGSPAFDDGEDTRVRVGKLREALRVFVADGIRLTPVTEGDERFYQVDLAVLPQAAPQNQEHKSRTPQLGAEAYDNRGCAGAIPGVGYGDLRGD